MRISQFKSFLEQHFPAVKFYNGFINKADSQCVGLYPRGSAPVHMAVGGRQNTSFSITPVSVLVHWGESSEACEVKARQLYDFLVGRSDFMVGSVRVAVVQMKEPNPVLVGRDAGGIVEMVFNMNVVYDL